MLKVYVNPIPETLSLAMHRVAKALRWHAPNDVRVVEKIEEADIQLIHLVSPDSMNALKAPRSVVIQYCHSTASGSDEVWNRIWNNAVLVWSYYDLCAPRFYRSPLGGDPVFFAHKNGGPRDIGCVTSGYTNGPGAEAIEEVAIASSLAGLTTWHLGPRPVGMEVTPTGWTFEHGVSDEELADKYGRSRFVSGLRFVEGFELPCVEGLMCGARPIVFDRPEMRKWYNDHAYFVPECSGKELVNHLLKIFESEPQPVTRSEGEIIRQTFNWKKIASGFWQEVLRNA